MFRIGDFSRIARVSCRLLRYYDELGLLAPSIIDGASGYRFYSAAQLPRLNRILVFKELGLSLEQIGQVIDNKTSGAELRAMLLIRRADVEQALTLEAERLRMIESRISQIDQDGALSVDDVLIRTEPAKTVLTARQTVRSFREARGIIQQLIGSVPRQLSKTMLGSVIAIAHSPEFEPEAIDVEIGYVLNERYDQPGLSAAGLQLQVRELPAVEHMAACVRVGLPEQAHLITGKIGRFLESSGYGLAGPSREVFLQPPQPERMEISVVEMQYPIAPFAGASR